jgi:Fe-S-cluster containining protein
MTDRRKVTPAEFEQIACNNCGACCETLWLPGPIELAGYLSAGESAPAASPAWRLENERFIAWLSALEPTGKVLEPSQTLDEGFTHQYCCSRFKRRDDGSGFCSAYEDRPAACRGFPYGKPVTAAGFEACSWNVEIVEDSRVSRGSRLLGSALKASRRLFSAPRHEK